MIHVMAVLVLMQAPAESPIKPLAVVARHMESGVNKFLKGETPAAALAPWAAGATDEKKLRGALKEAAVAKAEVLGFEYEISFYNAGAEVGRLSAFVWVEGDHASFMDFEFKEGPQPVQRGLSLDKVKAFDSRLADPAAALVGGIHQKKAERVEFTDPEKIAKRIGDERMAAEAGKNVRKAKEGAKAACEAIAALEYDEIRLGLDDVAILARQEGGTAVGVLTADFSRNEDKLSLDLDKFRPFKK
jgi:hypothetical protein